MFHHPGNPHSSLHLAQLRDEALERKAKHHFELQPLAPRSPSRTRVRMAAALRSLADRVEARPAPTNTLPPRYQRVP